MARTTQISTLRVVGFACFAGLAGLACKPNTEQPKTPVVADVPNADIIPLTFFDHFAVIPVRINADIDTRMVLDTGIGVTIVSAELCARIGCERSGTYTGERMSGQRLTIPLAHVQSLSIAGHTVQDVQIGIVDNPQLLPPGIDGIVGLGVFDTAPFTLDNQANILVLETPASLARRKAAGVTIPLTIQRDSASVTAFMSLLLPDGQTITTEIDSGSDALILHERYMPGLGVQPDNVRRVDGTDETGNSFTRYFTTLAGAVSPAAAPQLKQDQPRVMFQRIIHDGLVGRSFLQGFAATFDLSQSQLILGPSAASP